MYHAPIHSDCEQYCYSILHTSASNKYSSVFMGSQNVTHIIIHDIHTGRSLMFDCSLYLATIFTSTSVYIGCTNMLVCSGCVNNV